MRRVSAEHFHVIQQVAPRKGFRLPRSFCCSACDESRFWKSPGVDELQQKMPKHATCIRSLLRATITPGCVPSSVLLYMKLECETSSHKF